MRVVYTHIHTHTHTHTHTQADSIGPEGIMRLCVDMGIEPTDVRLLVLAWQLRAAEQGYFTRGIAYRIFLV